MSTTAPRQASTVAHPLDPLTADEIRSAVAIVRTERPDLGRPTFPLVVLREPPKAEVVAFAPGEPIARRADVVAYERDGGLTHEVLVDLDAGSVLGWTTVDEARPPILPADFEDAAEALRKDERFAAALRRRGIDDPQLVQVDPLSPGAFPQNPPGRRLTWATPYLRPRPEDNPYARPIENLRAAVDLDTLEVVEVRDGDVVPLSTSDGNFIEERPDAPYRDDLKALEIVQPDGVSFALDGHVLSWQRWRLHVALHPVDGLVLSDVRYRDGDRLRRIMHRAALAEMVVPYGDPHDGFYWRTYFDAGEYGMGRCTNSLQLGCDCLGEIRYMDAVVADRAGEPQPIHNAICIHEEDDSLLAKHHDPFTGHDYVRRSRKLVISFIATIGNYDYGFYWSLHQDGRIEMHAKATGIVLTRGVHPDEELGHAERLAPDLAAPHHQHLFNVRLDMAVDGDRNTVVERDLVASDAGPENPWGQAMEVRSTVIRREGEGRRRIDPLAARTWQVQNPAVRNAVGNPVAYELVPVNGPLMLASAASSVGRRAGFAREHLWVTQFAEDERHAAGEHPNQHRGGAGLPTWIQQDRPLENEDVVLWHTFGFSHAVRPEDWPIMPVDQIGFALRPVGFFDRTPALDVAPSRPGASGHGAGGSCCHD
jgi:primary-amine oxidase